MIVAHVMGNGPNPLCSVQFTGVDNNGEDILKTTLRAKIHRRSSSQKQDQAEVRMPRRSRLGTHRTVSSKPCLGAQNLVFTTRAFQIIINSALQTVG